MDLKASRRRCACALALIAVLLLLQACASGTIHELPAAGEGALMCPRCEAVWIQRPDPFDPDFLEYSSERVARCPDCRSAAATFFRTGRFEHTCPTCGDAPIHCHLGDVK